MKEGVLISDEYREQNALLHAGPLPYGEGGAKWAGHVVDIAMFERCNTILDYGCGKGMLAKKLVGIREYDPAIPGKDIATPSDLVVCTDVLEHIEPDKLDAVLMHLASVTLKRLFFNIATVPAVKVLQDGRNAHLLVRPAWWWRLQLEKYFTIAKWHPAGKSVQGEAVAPHVLPDILTVPALSDDKRNENVTINCSMVRGRLADGIPAHDRTASLMCYGPSLKRTFRGAVGDIYCVGASHRFLIDNGVIPIASIDCDPRERNAHQIGEPHKDVSYWLASCVDPVYALRLCGFDIELWHLHSGDISADHVWSIEPDAWILVGGGSVGLRAISLLYAQGYRKFELHGMDSSYEDGAEYAGAHLGPPKANTIKVRCGERWFTSNPSLVDYARQFLDDMRLWEGASFMVHGDGLLQEMVKHA